MTPPAVLPRDTPVLEGARDAFEGVFGRRPLIVRVGGTLTLPVNRYNSVKVYGSTGAATRRGGDFDTIGMAWQYRWCGGL